MEIITDTTTKQQVDAFLNQWQDDNDYIVAHTSGSTGSPKEIHLLKSDMLVSAKATCNYFGLNTTSILVSPLSADYIAGKMMIVRAMVSHSRLFMFTPTNSINQYLDKFDNIDLLAIVPSQVESLLLKGTNIDYIKNIIIGGAPLNPALEDHLVSRKINAYCTYGMTETCSHVALRHIGNHTYDAMPGIEFKRADDNSLIIKAPNFSFKTLHTNDIVELLSTSSFRWIGRKDNIINTGGIKVNPETIETIFAPHLNGYRFYITSLPHPKWGQQIILVVESNSEIPGIYDIINTIPNKFFRPKQIFFIKKLNTTSNGKLRRNDILKKNTE